MARKQTNSSNDVVTYWLEQIRGGKKYMDQFSSKKSFKNYREMYRGHWDPAYVPVNRTFSFGKSLIPQVYFRAPYVTVTARRPEFVQHAKVLEAVDNWLIQETMLKRTLKKSVLDAYIAGYGPIKIGYDSEYGYVPDQAVDRDNSTATQYGRSQKRVIEYKTQVQSGMPWALPTLPEDVIVPFGYRQDTDLPWIAHRILRPLEDVQQDQKYSNVSGLVGTRMALLDDESRKKVPFEISEAPYAELYEIRDKREHRIITLCENQILLSEYDELQIEGLPWEFIIFNEDPEHFFGISDVSIMEPQQLELNEVRTQQKKHRAIALLKFLIQKSTLSEADKDKLLSGDVGPLVEVDAEQITAVVQMLQPHVPPEFTQIIQEIRVDMRESMGFSENELGSFSPYHGKTATETMQVANSNDNRVNERKDVVADTMVNIVRKWNQIIFKFWDTERVVEVAGPDGQMGWVEYTGDMLKGEYTVRIDPESGFPVSKALKSQLAGELAARYGGDPLVNQIELRRMHLETFEWAFPGISQILLSQGVNPLVAQEFAAARQPSPMGSGGSVKGQMGNRGGGRSAGSTQNATPFEKFKQGGGK